MTIKQEAEVIYRYIVGGFSMEKIANSMGIEISNVSEIVKYANFNRDRGQRCNFQSGKDRGRYKPGMAAARGVTITRDMILEYLQDIEYWNYDFDEYVMTVADEMAEQRYQNQLYEQEQLEREERRRQQAAYEEQRRRQQAAYEEQVRREQQARAEALRKAQEAENARRAAEQAAKEREYPKYVQKGFDFLNKNKMQEAYNAFQAAQSCIDTYEIRAYIAKALALSGNAVEHADRIISELSMYRDFLDRNNQSMSSEYRLYMARAYAHKKRYSDAAYCYFMAAEPFYRAEDYMKADEIYTENANVTNTYTLNVENSAFKVACSRANRKNLTTEDYEYCVSWYTEAINQNQLMAYALSNRSYFYRMLGEYGKAISDAKTAITFCLNEDYVYSNLLLAQMDNSDFEDALKTMDKMDSLGYKYEPWLRGQALGSTQSTEDCFPYFIKQLRINPDHLESLERLSLYEADYAFATRCAIHYANVVGKGHKMYRIMCERALYNAERTGNDLLIEQALGFNPEERERRIALKTRAEEQARQERIRQEEERERILEQQRLAKEEAERKRLAEEAKRQEEEMLIALLF